MATLLLDKGAAVDAKNKDGNTPLHIGFRIHNPSTSTPQLLILIFILLLTHQYMYPKPLTLSPIPEHRNAKP